MTDGAQRGLEAERSRPVPREEQTGPQKALLNELSVLLVLRPV